MSRKCPVCQFNSAQLLFNGGLLPLSSYAASRDIEKSINAKKYLHKYYVCLVCSHIYNPSFANQDICYDSPTMTYNNTQRISKHIESICERVVKLSESLCADKPKVLEIGCGDGLLLRALSNHIDGYFIGFDPGVADFNSEKLIILGREFSPARDISEFSPDIIVARHVLEHFKSPRELLFGLKKAYLVSPKDAMLLIEVPCAEKCLSEVRVTEFIYEHPSLFTPKSLQFLLSCSGYSEISIERELNNEVLVAHARINSSLREWNDIQNQKIKYKNSKEFIRRYLSELKSNGNVIIWGGLSKAAVFINYYELDRDIFVVDSDPRKVGFYVPGTSHLIFSPYDLNSKISPDYIIVPAQWRALDIYAEIKKLDLKFKKILVYHDGALVDYDQFIKEIMGAHSFLKTK